MNSGDESASHAAIGFSLVEARRLSAGLFEPNPRIYWADFLVSWAVGITAFVAVLCLPRFSLGQTLSFAIAGLALYRAVMFIHELAHLPHGTFLAFRVAWNVLCGIPFLLPSFLYWTHLDHHRARHYGTGRDGEYLPLARRPPRYILFYLAESLVLPLLAVVRFAIFTPLAWISPRLRRLIDARFSAMVIDLRYLRPAPTKAGLRVIRLQEAACLAWCLGVLLVPRMVWGVWPVSLVLYVYGLAVFIMLLNAVRTLGSHRWKNADRRQMTFLEQTLDSVNYPHGFLLAELWGPVGMRYHALHHLFPGLPYHALPEAHRRLMEGLPANSPYRQAEQPSLRVALVALWRQAQASARRSGVPG